MDEVITLDDVFKCNECEFEAHEKSALVKHKETHFLVFLKEKKGDEQDKNVEEEVFTWGAAHKSVCCFLRACLTG